MVTEHVRGLKVVGADTIPELDVDEVLLVGSGTGEDSDGDGGSVIGHTLELGVIFCDLGHVEERDGGLVHGFDEQDLEGVPVEGDTL
jgi:hypothetical protein